jgi:hypothetical protein
VSPRRTPRLGILGAACLVLTLGCSGADDGDEPDPGDLPAPICSAGTRWQPGQVAFVEATASWQLDVLGVEGVRLSAVDFDGDGWTDLLARHAGANPDDFTPEGTRVSWLLRNTGQGTFEDVTLSSGFRQNRSVADPNLGRPGEVVAFADVDNDGDLDAYTGLAETEPNGQQETSEIVLNQGDGTFALGPEDSQLRLDVGDVPAGASFVDVDRNGLVDLWVPQNSINYSPKQDRLYAGDGTGRFFDVTEAVGLGTKPWNYIPDMNDGLSHTNAWSALACDLNGDGNAELLAASYGRAPNHLWQATGPENGSIFLNRSVASGYAYDQNLDWTDNESARCHCTLHPTDEDCGGVPPPQYIRCETDDDAFRWRHNTDREPFRLGGNSGCTVCADVDNDGLMDLLTTELQHWDVGASSDKSELLFNDGAQDVVFQRPGREATGLVREHVGIDWNEGDMTGAAELDFDNDGWADLYIGSSDYPLTKGLLYHQEEPRRFVQVPFAEGIDQNRSHGIAVADFDRDGDVDVVVGHSGARCSAGDCYETRVPRLFENVLGQGGNWVQLAFEGGAGTNRAAIGARVQVTSEEGVSQTREIGGGHGHYGAQHDLTLHFGLGASCRATVTVRWPDAALTAQTFEVVSGYRFRVVQGSPPEVVELEAAAP